MLLQVIPTDNLYQGQASHSENAPNYFWGKIASGLYVCCIIGLIGSYFAISTRQIHKAVYAQSTENWIQGKPNYLRAAFLDVNTGQTYNNGKATLTLGTDKIVETPQSGYVAFEITPPTDPIGSAALDFDIGGENLHIDFPITNHKSDEFKIPTASTRRAKEDKKQKVILEWEGEDTFELIPENGEIVRGLANEVYFIARRKGEPAAMTFRIISHEGVAGKLPKTISTNAFGVGKITLKPTTSLRLEIESVGEQTPSKGKINIFAVATQFNFQTQTPFVAYGDLVRGSVESVRQSGSILVDGYEKERWVSGGVFGLNKEGGGFEVKTSNEGNLMQVQVYHNFYRPGASWASRWVAIGESKNEGDYCLVFKNLATSVQELKSLKWATQVVGLSNFEKASQQECRFLLRAYLDAIPISFVNSHTIVNSREDDLNKLGKWKEEKKTQLKWMTGVFLVGGFFCLFWIVLAGISKKKKFQREIEDVLDNEDLPTDRFEGILFYLRVLTILIALATFIASMLMVMSFM